MQSYADAEALIDDRRVLAVPIEDSGEALIDIRDLSSIATDPTRTRVQQLSENPFQLRATVAEMLGGAQARLADGYQLQVKEGWRPIWVQEQLWAYTMQEIRDERPELSAQGLHRESTRFTAPPDIAPPHSTGGAVDLALLYEGMQVDLGWEFNRPGPGSRTAHPIADPARRHRDLLVSVMDAVGFVNYPQEWWHWSFGDRYWAFQTRQTTARYGPL
jgi:D-alanyl-D-alanine dipeptidase